MNEVKTEAFRNMRNTCAACGKLGINTIHVDLYLSDEETWVQVCRGCVKAMENAIDALLREEEAQQDPDEVPPTDEEQAFQRGIS